MFNKLLRIHPLPTLKMYTLFKLAHIIKPEQPNCYMRTVLDLHLYTNVHVYSVNCKGILCYKMYL